MHFNLLLSGLRARWRLFGVVLGITVVTAAVVSLLLPKTYRATASILVDHKSEQSLNSTALHPLLQPHERTHYMQTQMDIIGSEKVARKVVSDLKLASSPAVQKAYADKLAGGGAIEDWLVESLLQSLKVDTTQSSVVHVSYTSGDRVLTAQIANAFAKAYVDTMLELRVGPTRQAAAWFDEQWKSLRTNLEGAQGKLTEYHKKKGIVSADERLDVENARLAELSVQAVKTQDQTFDLRAREQQARDKLNRGGSLEDLPEVLASSHIQKLRADLVQGEVKLQELSSQYGRNYPQYQRVEAENRILRSKIYAEMKTVVAGVESSARQSARRESDLNNAIQVQRSRLLELKVDRNELMVLTRDVESAQRAYDIALQRAVTSQVESRASQPDVIVLDPATPPIKPYRPRITLNVALAGVVGSMLGAGLVVLLEVLERRVRRREDLENALNTPLLGVLHSWHPPRHQLAAFDISRALPGPR